MDNLTTISNVKDNILEFNVHVTGADDNDMTVQFIIESDDMDLTFNSERGKEENLWFVKVPALSILETTSYPFRIDVIIEGYHMDVMKGSVNVIGNHDIYVNKPVNVTLSPSKKSKSKDSKKPIEKKEVTIKSTDKTNNKFEMTPVKVKDGKELFDALTKNKVNKERKTNNKLDDKIIEILAKVKDDNKKVDAKSKVRKPKNVAKKVKENILPPTNAQPITQKTPAGSEIILEDVINTKKSGNVKSIAEKIIQSVTTGIDSKKDDNVVETPKDVKLKKILAEDAKTSKRNSRKATKKPVGIKKIGKYSKSTTKNIDDS